MGKEAIPTKAPAVSDNKDEKLNRPEYNATIDYDFGETAEQQIKRFGDPVVHANAKRQFIVSFRRKVRVLLIAGKTPAEIQIEMDGWVPPLGPARKIVDPVEAALELTRTMTPEQKKEFLEGIRKGA